MGVKSISGGGGRSHSSSHSKSQSTSSSGTRESGLSREQLAILKQRQQQYNDILLPLVTNALNRGMEQSTPGSQTFTSFMGNNAQQVNAAFDSAQAATSQNLARQGLAGQPNTGVSASLRAANERARASALANAYASQLQSSADQQQKWAGLAGQFAANMSPQPTTSAAFHQESHAESSGSSVSRGSSWNVQGSLTRQQSPLPI